MEQRGTFFQLRGSNSTTSTQEDTLQLRGFNRTFFQLRGFKKTLFQLRNSQEILSTLGVDFELWEEVLYAIHNLRDHTLLISTYIPPIIKYTHKPVRPTSSLAPFLHSLHPSLCPPFLPSFLPPSPFFPPHPHAKLLDSAGRKEGGREEVYGGREGK